MSYFILTILSSNVNLVVIDPYRSHFPMYLANITSPRIPVGYSWVQSHSESHRRSVNPTAPVDSHDRVMCRGSNHALRHIQRLGLSDTFPVSIANPHFFMLSAFSISEYLIVFEFVFTVNRNRTPFPFCLF